MVRRNRFVILGSLMLVGVIAAVAVRVTAVDEVVTLVAVELVFRGDNPTLYVTAGSKVKLVFRNEADGVIHQVTLTDLDIETEILQPGESESICFRAPAAGGVLTYACTFHSLMTGQVVVRSGDRQPTALRP